MNPQSKASAILANVPLKNASKGTANKVERPSSVIQTGCGEPCRQLAGVGVTLGAIPHLMYLCS